MAQTFLRAGVKFDQQIIAFGGGIDSLYLTGPVGNNCKAIAAGLYGFAALRYDGTIINWGGLNEGTSDAEWCLPPIGKGYITIAMSKSQNWGMALAADGHVIYWGDDTLPLVGSTPTETGFTAISAGGVNGLALRADGSIICWGNDTYHQVMDCPSGTGYTAIAASEWACAALKSDGSIVVWGTYNLQYAASYIPPTGNDFVAISGGYRHFLALKSDGSIVGWGIPASNETTCPTSKNFVAISAGWWFSVGLKKDGSITCWGAGFGAVVSPPTGSFNKLAATKGYNLAIKSASYPNDIVGWGNTSSPLNPATGYTGIAIAAGELCGLLITDYSGGYIYAWGIDTYHQISQKPNSSVTGVLGIAVGKRHCVAIKNDGTLIAWGDGDGSGDQTNCPDGGVFGPWHFTKIAAGDWHNLAIRDNTKVVAWGSDYAGQVSECPVTETGFTEVSAGANHSVVIQNGSIVCWGDNSHGQLGAPVGSNFAKIAAGSHHTIALDANGTLYGWGDNSSGQIDCPEGTGYTAIAAGGDTSLAVKADGSIIVWGDDSYNQTGPKGKNYKMIAAGNYGGGVSNSLAIKSVFRAKAIGGDYLQCIVNLGNNTLTAPGTQFTNNERVRLANVGGALPAASPSNLLPRTTYFVRNVSEWTFQLAATFGGSPITLTDIGTGSHYITTIQRRPIMRCAKCVTTGYTGDIKVTFYGITLQNPESYPDPNIEFTLHNCSNTDWFDMDEIGPESIWMWEARATPHQYPTGWHAQFTFGNHFIEVNQGVQTVGFCGQLLLTWSLSYDLAFEAHSHQNAGSGNIHDPNSLGIPMTGYPTVDVCPGRLTWHTNNRFHDIITTRVRNNINLFDLGTVSMGKIGYGGAVGYGGYAIIDGSPIAPVTQGLFFKEFGS